MSNKTQGPEPSGLAYRQQGFTLPELLIGVGLGLLVMAAGVMAYGTSRQTWAAMSAANSVQANAQMAWRHVRDQALLAGAATLSAAPASELQVSLVPADTTAALAGVNGSKYVESLTVGHARALSPYDCQGNGGDNNNTPQHPIVQNHYKLNTKQELSCKDLNLSGSTYQALAEGVEDFQLRYAEVEPINETLQWKTADQVTNMAHVVALELCLRVASVQTVHHTPPKTLQKGCENEALPSDGRVRRVLRRVITLPNRAGLLP